MGTNRSLEDARLGLADSRRVQVDVVLGDGDAEFLLFVAANGQQFRGLVDVGVEQRREVAAMT